MAPPPDFGTRLKQAREARGISLRDIASTTKISMAALDALEHGDASRLPGGIFSRAFVRSYAVEVGLDPEATVREFLERFPDDVNPIRDMTPPGLEHLDQPSGRVGRMVLVAAVLILAAGTAVGLMRWSGTLPGQQPVESLSPVATAPLPVATPAPPTEPDPSPVATAGSQGSGAAPDVDAAPADVPAAVVPPSSTISDVAPVANVDTLRLGVQSTDRCWVRIVADGEVVFSREMAAGEREMREARGSFVITVGNAGAFQYTINDVPGRSLGGAGKVVTVRIDRASINDFVAP